MPAVPVHHTKTSDGSWDGSAVVADISSDATEPDLATVFAWKPTGDDVDNKSDWKFPHHQGVGGAAVQEACSAVVAALNGGRGGANVPEGDRRGVYNHVIAHLKDAGVEEADLPELKSGRRPLTTRSMLDPRFELRRQRRAGMRGIPERRVLEYGRCNVEVRSKPSGTGGTNYSFTGYAAVYEAPFQMWDMWGEEYVEVCGQGACTRTLANSPDVPFLIGHDSGGISLARTKSGTLQLSQDDHGLYTEVPDMDGRSPLVQSLVSAIERGDMDEMSLAFVCRQQQWSPDYMERRVVEMDIHRGDVSIVCLGANPATAGASVGFPVSEAARQHRPAESRMPTAPYSAHDGETYECPQCSSVNDLDAHFCDQCGAKMGPIGSSQVDEDETQQCQSCLCMNATDAKYCDQCGMELAGVIPWRSPGGGYAGGGYYGQRRPAERRASDEVSDLEAAPDYNPAVHGDGSIQCQNSACPVDGGAMNSQDAKFCDQCGGPLYGSDGTLILDDSGVVEEAVGDANLLGSGLPVESLRRQLDLLRWRS